MGTAIRLLIGTIAAFLCMLAAVECYGWINVWTIGWMKQWRNHLSVFLILREAAAIAPPALCLAAILRSLAPSRRAWFPACCIAAAILIDIVGVAAESPRLILPTIRLGSDIYMAFLVGVPLAVMALNRLRSN